MRFIDFTFLETTLPRPEKNMKPRDFGLEHHFTHGGCPKPSIEQLDHDKPSSYWGIPIDGNPYIII